MQGLSFFSPEDDFQSGRRADKIAKKSIAPVKAVKPLR
jgi:hypothetical protein